MFCLCIITQVWFSCRLLVGAPRTKRQHQVNVTGAVYQCDLNTVSEHCQPIEFESEGLSVYLRLVYPSAVSVRHNKPNLIVHFFLEFLNSRNINDQWMGVRVSSQGPGQNILVREQNKAQLLTQKKIQIE